MLVYTNMRPVAVYIVNESSCCDNIDCKYSGDIINMNGDYLKPGYQAIRVVDSENQTIETVGYTDRGRWYPTVMTLANGNI